MKITPFSSPLQKATLLKRYKRFFADIELENGEKTVAHCANTGSMKSCFTPGCTIYVSDHRGKGRKLDYTWELTETAGGFIGVNTARPNQVVAEALAAGLVQGLEGYTQVQREARFGEHTRFDFLLQGKAGDARDCYVEVKNTTLFCDDMVQFPDAVTERGQKHLRELANAVQQGARAVILFLVNRPEGKEFSSAAAIDPEYAKLLEEVVQGGVEVVVVRCLHTLEGSYIGDVVGTKF